MAGMVRLLRAGHVEYRAAAQWQRDTAASVRSGGEEAVALLQHPPVYTLGRRGGREHVLRSAEELAARGAELVESDRGGDVTFHGPGQLVGYPILDLRRWSQGPLWYVRSLEAMLIDALSAFDIKAVRVPGRTGVWVGEAKIAAIGVRVSRGVTSHGFALNVDPDLDYFSKIIPCGLPDAAVTSMAEMLQTGGRGDAPTRLRTPAQQTPKMGAVMDAVVAAFARAFPVECSAAEHGSGLPGAAEESRRVAASG